MGRLEGRVALVTGGARGQGRAHAEALAAEGADVVLCDLADQIASIPYAMGTADDLAETVRLVEKSGRRCVATKADVRSTADMDAVVALAIQELGKIDILVANAGVCGFAPAWELTDEQWDDMIGVDLTGAFKSIRAVLPHMLERGYGRIVATSSMAGRMGNRNLSHYVAAKWGVIGFVKTVALEVADRGITVNVVCPATTDTPMVHNDALYSLFAPDIAEPTKEQVEPRYRTMNPQRVAWIDPTEVSRAVLYLVDEEARHITGSTLDIACGGTAMMP
jgi:SDR family mycofactocin-dependent oxidoreductase